MTMTQQPQQNQGLRIAYQSWRSPIKRIGNNKQQQGTKPQPAPPPSKT